MHVSDASTFNYPRNLDFIRHEISQEFSDFRMYVFIQASILRFPRARQADGYHTVLRRIA